MKRFSWLFLTLLPLLSGCPKRQTTEAPRDYDGVRQRANDAHSKMDADSPQ